MSEAHERSALKNQIWSNLDGTQQSALDRLDGYSKFIEYLLNFMTIEQLQEVADVYDQPEAA